MDFKRLSYASKNALIAAAILVSLIDLATWNSNAKPTDFERTLGLWVPIGLFALSFIAFWWYFGKIKSRN